MKGSSSNGIGVKAFLIVEWRNNNLILDLHIFIPWSSPPKFETVEQFKLEKIPSVCPDELCLGQSLTAFFPITGKESRNLHNKG